MIKRSVLWEQAGGGSILFWVDDRGELDWIASPVDDGLRMPVENLLRPPNLEVYRCSKDGEYISQAPSNPHYGRRLPSGVIALLAHTPEAREERRERVRRFAKLLRESEVPA